MYYGISQMYQNKPVVTPIKHQNTPQKSCGGGSCNSCNSPIVRCDGSTIPDLAIQLIVVFSIYKIIKTINK
jgi:hypothetical protein